MRIRKLVQSTAPAVLASSVRAQAAASSLAARALCPVGYSICDSSYCISHLSTCCASGNGASCPYGYDCMPDGNCCPQGAPCTISRNSPAQCASDDRKMCGGLCVPSDAVCCEQDSTYCYAGQQCVAGGGCSGTALGLGAGPALDLEPSGAGSGTAATVTGSGAPTATGGGDDSVAAGNARVDGALLGAAGVVGVVVAMLVWVK